MEEMLMFSGLEAQSEITRLLDELYGNLDRTSLDEAGGCVAYASRRRGDEPTREAQVRAREEHQPLRDTVQAAPNHKLSNLAVMS
jgi:hypothetical protein